MTTDDEERIRSILSELLDAKLSSELTPQQHAEDHQLIHQIRAERSRTLQLYDKVRSAIAASLIVSLISGVFLLIGVGFVEWARHMFNIKQ